MDRRTPIDLLHPWREWHRPLMGNVTLMIALALVAAVGVAVDDRRMLGESVWVKPLKFGPSPSRSTPACSPGW